MELKISKIADRGNLEKERVVFKASGDLPVGDYVLFQSTKHEESGISSFVKKTFWFPDNDIKSGDLVVLYTRKGSHSVKENKDGTKTYFFYWLQSEPIWTQGNTAIVLLNVLDWEYKFASDTALT